MRKSKEGVEEHKGPNEKLAALNRLRSRIMAAAKPDNSTRPETVISDLVEEFPLLHLSLLAPFVEGGPEEGATLILWGREDGLGALLHLKHLRVKAFFDAPSLAELLQAMEKHLDDPDAKWQSDRPSGGSRRTQKRFSGKPR